MGIDSKLQILRLGVIVESPLPPLLPTPLHITYKFRQLFLFLSPFLYV